MKFISSIIFAAGALIFTEQGFANPSSLTPAGLKLYGACEKVLKGSSPVVRIEWNNVEKSGYVLKLIKDPSFLKLPFDFTDTKEDGSYLTAEEFEQILNLPIVKSNIVKFVTEAYLSPTSNLYFKILTSEFEKSVMILTERLAAAGEQEVFNLFLDYVQKDPAGRDLVALKAKTAFDKGPAPKFREIVVKVVNAKTLSIVHLTRGLESVGKPGSVDGFTVFGAGRFGVTVTFGKGETLFFVLETEVRVGHLNPVDPGATRVDGYVGLSDNESFGAITKKFTRDEVKELLVAMLTKHGIPSSIKIEPAKRGGGDKLDAGSLRSFINALAAIYANGNVEDLKAVLP